MNRTKIARARNAKAREDSDRECFREPKLSSTKMSAVPCSHGDSESFQSKDHTNPFFETQFFYFTRDKIASAGVIIFNLILIL